MMNLDSISSIRRVARGSRVSCSCLGVLALGLFLAASPVRAGWGDTPSTVRLANVTVVARDAKTATVRFDLAWQNAWRHEVNHDAVWVFFKARANGAGEWQPVRLVADKVRNPAGYVQGEGGTPLEFIVPDGAEGFLGLFVRMAEYGCGNVSAKQISAVVELKDADPARIELRAYALEMVYVPEGAFNLGSGGLEWYRFYQYTDGSQNQQPYRVTGPGAIPTGQKAGRLWARKAAQPEDGGEIPATFPNGYAAFYCMKKQLTAGQYCDFVNTLPPSLAPAYVLKKRFSQSASGSNIVYKVADPEHIVAGESSWADNALFSAWAGLRLLTELEFEKLARGPMDAGWDTGDGFDHPSYWNAQDCGGGWNINEGERVVSVANAQGRSYKGSHGRGTLELPADWPKADAVGIGVRGGFAQYGHPSNRLRMVSEFSGRDVPYGWRGARTAPKEAAE